ncbi:EAL domain-containing protein [Trichocoleus sp. FACHB-591]|uniref:EAL domain-containing protein n=1 Tax=Trichocoleus sp. FACHB-591 TaxID=2692872 RepID=UPI001686DC16|nr:EAL domain-containing protein [Trichocoleus sp. FACHB-591]MBD2095914.1 EAL domain-containing protein [Trichocoleus sp. FACHB-591]
MTGADSSFQTYELGSNEPDPVLFQLDQHGQAKGSQRQQGFQQTLEACQHTALKWKDLWSTLVRLTPLPVAITCLANQQVLLQNQLVTPLFGLAQGEVYDPTDAKFYASVTEPAQMLSRLQSGERLVNYELQLQTAHGELRDTRVSAELVEYEAQLAILWIWTEQAQPTQRNAPSAAPTAAATQFQAIARQQAAVAELGQQALAGVALNGLFNKAVRLVAQVLEVNLCGLWKLLPNDSTLLLQAGIGWQSGLVGTALVGTQAHSQVGSALLTQNPVLVEDLQVDTQFSGPPLLHNHRVVSGISLPILGPTQAFGVLSCYTTERRTFTPDDVHFLQAIANVLATALARHESEARLHLMERAIAASSNGIVLTDASQSDNPIIYVNPAFEAMTGYRAEEAIGQNCRFLQGANRDAPALEQLRSAIQAQQECQVTLQNYRKDGTPFWNELYVAPVFDAEGYLTHCVGIQTDITERRQAEVALRQQEEQYRRIVETATEGIWMLDQNSQTSYVNQQTATMLGYSIEEMLGQPLFAFMDEEGQALAKLYLERRQQGIPEMHDFKFCRKDGTTVWTMLSTAPLFDEQSNYIGALGMLTDVTARRQAEAAFREGEQRLNGILRSLEDVVWSISATSQETLYLNPAAERIYHRTVTEFFDHPNLWSEVVHPDDLKRVRAATQALRKKKKLELEYRILQPDGSVRWLYERRRVIRDATGQVVRIDGIATDITERKWMEAQLVHDAYHDALTGLPNRVLFMDRLKQAIARTKRRSNYAFAVLFLDLDRFKVINDSLGHLVGDQLLVTIAQRLASCLDPAHTIARLGGDEFTILLDPIAAPNDAATVAEQIHQALQLPFNLDGYEVFTTVSIGIALSATGYNQPEDVLRDADAALYQAKEQGKARFAIFDTAMHNQAMSLLQLEMALRWALERQELRVFYQPLVSLTTGRIVGFEALVRWLHPEQGLISPAEFIAIAEETGLIVPIGQWVLTESCRQLREWQTQFPTASTLSISVNLSSKQFSQPNLVSQIEQVLQETGLRPDTLKLEITESGIMNNTESAALLRQLRALQVQLCIDDFGTGYSSLSRLRQFPIHTLKIDRSFVSTMREAVQDAEVVQAIITLAHNLGMNVVAEGIETAEQLAHLRRLHCEQGQGYFFSKPLNSQAATALLAAGFQW